MLNVQKYLIEGKNLEDLTAELGIKVQRHDTLPLAILNYDQIESPKTHPIVRECRGLVLNTATFGLTARGFNRFFNWGEVADEMPHFDFSDFCIHSKEDGCFGYNTTLNLWDGGTIRIGELVKKKLSVQLIGMDQNGNLVPATVTNWFNNGTKNNWVDIVVQHDISPGVKCGNHPNKLRVTVNHSIYLNGEFRPAIEATIGDKLLTFRRDPSKDVLHFMRSALLGDASICCNGSSWKFTDTHQKTHSNYVAHISLWLGECSIRMRNRISGFGTEMLDVSSKAYLCLKELRDQWYPKGIKVVPTDLSWVDDFSIAKWYMDDGCLSHTEFQQDRALFATNGFQVEDVKRLALKLQEMYGVDAVVTPSKGGYAIRINAGRNNEIDRFWRAIAPHIVACMRYKLPEKYRNTLYVKREIGKEETVKIESSILSVSPVAVNKKNFPNGRSGFDITTTTGNYFAKGTLVHNSLVLLYFFEGRWMANTRGSFGQWKIEPLDFTWEQAFCKALKVEKLNDLHGKLNPELCYVCEFCSPYNKIVRRYPDPVMYLLTVFRGNDELSYREVDQHVGDIFLRPHRYEFKNIDQITEFLKAQETADPTYEGVVICDKDGRRWKVKSSTYLSLHRMKGEGDNLFHPKYLIPWVLSGETSELLTYFPEVTEKLQEVETRMLQAWNTLEKVWTDNWQTENQKDFALSVVGKTPFTGLLFSLRKEYGKEQTLEMLKKAWRNNEDGILKTLFK